jgi:hypothetical protein
MTWISENSSCLVVESKYVVEEFDSQLPEKAPGKEIDR